jgi:1-acyl-sn-glycerol-3-phosphate acyltransferase
VVKPYVVFLAQRKIKTTFIIRWFTKFNNVLYIDKEYPGYSFFKELLQYLDAGRLIVVYPEGTRSRTGKMLIPKTGFVKLAMTANVPIIPVALKGTYEILPPQKRIPRFKRCEVTIGKRFYISPDNSDLKDIFFRRTGERKFGKLTDDDLQEIAVRIMDKIRIQADEKWDDTAVPQVQKFGIREHIAGLAPAIQT